MKAVALLIVATAAAAAAQETSPIVIEGWRHLPGPGPVDPGIGVVALPWPDHSPWADTLPLYTDPADGIPAGHFVFASAGAGGWVFALVWGDTLTTNLLEYAYEGAGLPFDSVSRDGRWVRVIPGFVSGGAAVHGWVRVRPDVVELVRWQEILPEQDLFFRDGVAPAFFAAPEGTPASFPLPAEGGDYILHPLETRGVWMRVRAVTPSDMCADPEQPVAAELWIRYLDDAGRPLVWYYTRGC